MEEDNIFIFLNQPQKSKKKEIFKMSKFRASSLAVLIGLAAALLLFVAQDVEAGVVENLDEGNIYNITCLLSLNLCFLSNIFYVI